MTVLMSADALPTGCGRRHGEHDEGRFWTGPSPCARPSPRTPALNIGHYLVFSQDGELRRVPIAPGGMVVGRQPPADLVIPVPDISRKHCRIDMEGGPRVDHRPRLDQRHVRRRRTGRSGRRGCATAAGCRSARSLIRYERRDKSEVAEEAELADELRRAADYVRAILPQPITEGPVQAEWWFVPSSKLGGDAFGYQFLDDEHVHRLRAGCLRPRHRVGDARRQRRQRAAPARAARGRFPRSRAGRRRAERDVPDGGAQRAAASRCGTSPTSRRRGISASARRATIRRFWSPRRRASRCRYGCAGRRSACCRSGNWGVGRAEVPPGSRLYVFSDGAFEIVEAERPAMGDRGPAAIMKGLTKPGVSEPQRLYRGGAGRRRTGARWTTISRCWRCGSHRPRASARDGFEHRHRAR